MTPYRADKLHEVAVLGALVMAPGAVIAGCALYAEEGDRLLTLVLFMVTCLISVLCIFSAITYAPRKVWHEALIEGKSQSICVYPELRRYSYDGKVVEYCKGKIVVTYYPASEGLPCRLDLNIEEEAMWHRFFSK